jgi:Polyketide cyclase / dehydrase and lipid transport
MKAVLASAAIIAALAAPLPALADPAYITIVLTKDVNRTPAQTWAKIGGYCAIQDWFKVPCSISSGDGKSVGTVRNLKRDTATIVEVMVAQTPWSYTYTQPATTVLYHGTLAVEPTDSGKHTKIVYTLFYDPTSLGTPDKVAADKESRVKRFSDGLDAMKALAEAQ